MAQEGLDAAAGRVKPQKTAPVDSDSQAAVAVECRAIRPAVVLGHQRPPSDRIDAKDTAVGDVGHIEVACAVEERAFQEIAQQCPPRLASAQSVRRGLQKEAGIRVQTSLCDSQWWPVQAAAPDARGRLSIGIVSKTRPAAVSKGQISPL